MLAFDLHGSEVAEQGEGHELGAEELLGEALDGGGSDGFDLTGDLLHAKEAAEVHLLAGEVGHSATRTFEADDDVAFELILGAFEFRLGDGLLFKTGQFDEGKLEELFGLVDGGSGVDGERAGVVEGVHLGVDGVGEALVFADGLEEARAHAAAEHGVEEVDAVAVGVVDRGRGDSEAELDLLEGFFALERDVGVGDGRLAGGGGCRGGGQGVEVVGYLLDEGVVVEVAGGGEDHVAGGEAVGVEAEEGGLVEARDGLGGAEDGAAEGVVLPEVLGEELVDEVVGVVFVHLDLFEDDALLAGDVLGREGGVEDEVGEEIEGGGDVLVEDLDVEADHLFAGEGVEVAADGVDLAGELLGGAGGGALEDHVLDEVGDPVEGGGLVAGAGADPGAHGDAADVGHGLGEDEEAIGEHGLADVAGGLIQGEGGGAELICGDCWHASPSVSIVSQRREGLGWAR